MRIGITGRLLAATSVLGLVIAVVFVFLLLAMRQANRARSIAEHSRQEIGLAREVRNELIDVEASQRGFIITGDERFLETWDGASRALPAKLAALRQIAEPAVQAERAEQLQREGLSYLNDYAVPLVDAARRGDPSVKSMVEEIGRPRINGLRHIVDTYNAEEVSQNLAVQADADHAYQRVTLLAAGGLGVSVITATLIAAYLARGVVAPVRRTARMAQRLAAGDLAARVPESGKAEIGVLERSFNAMAQSLQRGRDEQAALRRVATLVAHGDPSHDVFSAVSREVGQLLDVEITRLLRFEADGTAKVVAAWRCVGDPVPVGSRIPIDATVAAPVRQTGEPARIVEQSPPELPGGPYAAVGAPVKVGGTLWGAITALSPEDRPLPEGTEARMAEFTDLLGTAIANAQARADLMASRARIVTAADGARRRIERNLHDSVQQRLVALCLRIRAFQADSPSKAPEVSEELNALDVTLTETLAELRDVCHGIHPGALSHGLTPALKSLSHRSKLPIELDLHVDEVLPPSIAAAAYFVVAEAFSNAAKHGQPSVVRLSGEVREDRLILTVGDDGVGGADPSRGSGLTGLIDRVEALGGMLTIDSPAGAGTTLLVELPLTEPGSE
jgi:signal transduction histidine kinase